MCPGSIHCNSSKQLLLLLLSRFSCVQLCATPETAAHQAPPSLGFSRQEHWSGLPFPSPIHENEKWKWSCSVVSNCSWPHGLQPTRLLRPWDFPGKSTVAGSHCLLHPFIQQQTSKETMFHWVPCSHALDTKLKMIQSFFKGTFTVGYGR